MLQVNEIFLARFPKAVSDEMHIIGRALKINAEAGEVGDAALAHLGLKILKPGEDDTYKWVQGEVADVLLATWMFCIKMDIDPLQVLADKADQIINAEERHD
mgnify:FL=1